MTRARKFTLEQQIEQIGEKLLSQNKPLTYENFLPEIFGYYAESSVRNTVSAFRRSRGMWQRKNKTTESQAIAESQPELVIAVQELAASVSGLAVFLESIDARLDGIDKRIAALEKEWKGE